jgi:hypothetical protein
MAIRHLTKKIKLSKLRKIRNAPRWADIKKLGMKRARTRRINVDKIDRWSRSRVRV